MTDLVKEAERKGLRELAKDRDRSKKELIKEKQRGFFTINDFLGESKSDSVERTYRLNEMEKRKLQGLFGEKVARFVEGRIRDFLKNSMGDQWEVKKGIKVKMKGSKHKSMFYGLKPDENSNLKCSGKSIAHYGLTNQEIREEIEFMHFHVSERLFKKFQEYQAPSIDECYYAVKKQGKTKKHEYRAYDRASGSYDAEGETIECSLEKLTDFKIICLEVETTREKASNLLSKTQREVRDIASKTAFMDFYLARVEYDINSSKIPDNVKVEIDLLNE